MSDADVNATMLPWQGVDGVLVINMDTNTSRMEAFRSNVAAHLPQDRVERLSAVVGRALPSYGQLPWFTDKTGQRASFWGGTGGCTLSHFKAVAYAKSRGWKNVLIFEDDVVAEHADAVGMAVAKAIKLLRGTYILYLGYNQPAPRGYLFADVGEAEIWKTEGVLAAHAYLVPESAYDTILADAPATEADIWEWLSRYRAIDVYYRDFLPLKGVNIYVMKPQFYVQSAQDSDIAGEFFNAQVHGQRVAPIPVTSLDGFFCSLLRRFRALKVKLNSMRTHRRARKNGFPGFRKRKK